MTRSISGVPEVIRNGNIGAVSATVRRAEDGDEGTPSLARSYRKTVPAAPGPTPGLCRGMPSLAVRDSPAFPGVTRYPGATEPSHRRALPPTSHEPPGARHEVATPSR